MSPLCGNIRICIEECRLNKKLVGTARERDDPVNVSLMASTTCDLLSRAARSACCLSTPRGMDGRG
jgi:hypothetical protein